MKIIILIVFYIITVSAEESKEIFVPRTKTLNKDEYRFDLHSQQTIIKTDLDDNKIYWGLSRGLLDTHQFSIEAGLDWQEPTRKKISNALLANFKIAYKRIEVDGWSIAFGSNNIYFSPTINNPNFVKYLNFENLFGEFWRIGIGAYMGENLAASGDTLSEKSGLTLSVTRAIQKGVGTMNFEWQSGRSRLGFFVFGLNVFIRDGVFGKIGYGIANNRSFQNDWFFVGTSILF